MFSFKHTGGYSTKNTSMASFTTKYAEADNRRLATLPPSVGRGDTGGGDAVGGNTHHPVANAQRDGVPDSIRDAKRTMNTKGKTLESKKKNKTK